MILCDKEIEKCLRDKKLVIEPYDKAQLQPASYDFKLGNSFQVFNLNDYRMVDVKDIPNDLTRLVTIKEPGGFMVLHAHEFVLGVSIEHFEFGDDVVGRLEGKSSLGRLGIIVHATAGYFDPGFKGTATVELSNLSGIPFRLYPGMLIGQMSFQYLTGRVERKYGDPSLKSRYTDQQTDPVASRYESGL